MRLRRSRLNGPGWTRRRRGRGFSFTDESQRPLEREELERCRSLAIPPAWSDVWICPWPNGHIQAVGRDGDGRLQYLYHADWRTRRDVAKFERMPDFGRALPAARAQVISDIGLPGMPRERALATGFRILDLSAVRVGGEAYARERGTEGLATLRRDHVATRGERVDLNFPGKSGRDVRVELQDRALADAVRALRRRRGGGDELLAWREGRVWRDVRSQDINEYVREVTGCEATAKDFRTWHANVLVIAELAGGPVPGSTHERRRRLVAAVNAVAEHLGNTPAVARRSYVDPRLLDRYLEGALDPVLTSAKDAENEELLIRVLEA